MPVTTEVRVRYAETDQMGIVYYANYLIWFEIGRVELLRSLGLAYSQLELDHQCILPVVEANCRYKSPARYDDRIAIETRPSLLRGSVIKFAYSLYREPAHPGEERKLLTGVRARDGGAQRDHDQAEQGISNAARASARIRRNRSSHRDECWRC